MKLVVRSSAILGTAAAALFTLSLAAHAQDSSTEKSAEVKGPPNANKSDGATPHTSEKMKGPPNANGYDSSKPNAAGAK